MPDYQEFDVKLRLFEDGSPPMIPLDKNLWDLLWDSTLPMTRWSSQIIGEFGFQSLATFAVPDEMADEAAETVNMAEYHRRMKASRKDPK